MWLSYPNRVETDSRGPAAHSSADAHPVYGQRRLCPRCGHDVIRVRRRHIDRFISLAVPVHRYHCLSMACGWKGNMRTRSG